MINREKSHDISIDQLQRKLKQLLKTVYDRKNNYKDDLYLIYIGFA